MVCAACYERRGIVDNTVQFRVYLNAQLGTLLLKTDGTIGNIELFFMQLHLAVARFRPSYICSYVSLGIRFAPRAVYMTAEVSLDGTEDPLVSTDASFVHHIVKQDIRRTCRAVAFNVNSSCLPMPHQPAFQLYRGGKTSTDGNIYQIRAGQTAASSSDDGSRALANHVRCIQD